jgi:hypothetical protein
MVSPPIKEIPPSPWQEHEIYTHPVVGILDALPRHAEAFAEDTDRTTGIGHSLRQNTIQTPAKWGAAKTKQICMFAMKLTVIK